MSASGTNGIYPSTNKVPAEFLVNGVRVANPVIPTALYNLLVPDASGARFAIIIGDDEAQVGEISIKPLREAADQIRVGLTEAVDLLKRAL